MGRSPDDDEVGPFGGIEELLAGTVDGEAVDVHEYDEVRIIVNGVGTRRRSGVTPPVAELRR